eukprot:scaffold303516_cov48-Prasinocladus_malaysianus.AAC.1
MVCKLARHLLRQEDCDCGSITILTPYLGQLSEIRKKLVELQVGSELNERDVHDLTEMGLMDEAARSTAHTPGPALRAATVDNFQGEESDIIITSLVRSNRYGDIGFLSSEQRVNVMLSRARNGMYIFGNMECLTNCRSAKGRDLWRRIEGLL